MFIKNFYEFRKIHKRTGDQEGTILDCVVTKKRDKKAAKKVLKKLIKSHGKHHEIVTDKL